MGCRMMNKGQAAVMDALFFMMICAVTATLLFYVSSIYGQSIDQQISAIYNFEYTGNALVAIQGVDDYAFWNGLKEKVIDEGEEESIKYIEGYEEDVWNTVVESSPSNINFLCFEGGGCEDFCYPESIEGGEKESYYSLDYAAYTSSFSIGQGCRAIFKVYY